jgi:hypothetical protein
VRLRALAIADDPATWEALGYAVAGDRLDVGGVTIRLAGRGAGEGILGWHVEGLASAALPVIEPGDPPDGGAQPNGVIGVDHVVALTGDFDAAVAALAADGLETRRVREVPGPEQRRQAFYVLETALLELAGPADGVDGVAFWGLTLVAQDLDALAARLGDRLGTVRDAVQPGRRIATLRREAGSSVPIAFMSRR